MSWSVNGRGKVEAVAVEVATEFERITYLKGPEAKLFELAQPLITAAIAAQPADTSVKVECSGHASSNGVIVTQRVSILIEPIEK
jgi:hypothetical protein